MEDSAPGQPGSVHDRVRQLLCSMHDLSGADDLGTVLQRTVELACQLTQARYGVLGIIGEPHPAQFTHFITSGLGAEELAGLGARDPERWLLGRLMQEPGRLRLEDFTHESDAVCPAPGHPPVHSFLGMPVRIGVRVFGNLYLADKAGKQAFTAEDELAIEGLASVAGTVVDAMRRRLESRVQTATVETIRQINHALLTVSDPVDVVPLVTEQAVRVTGADVAAVVLPTAAGAAPAEILAATGAGADVVLDGMRAQIAEAFATGVAQHRAPEEPGTLLDRETGPGHTSIVPVRLRLGDQVALVVQGWRPAVAVGPRSTQDLIDSLADQVGLVLDRATSARDHEALSTLADRERIARDLHDLVVQRIFAAGLALKGATRLTDDPGVLQRIDATIGELDGTIRDIRSTIYALQTATTGVSLRSQVRDLVDRYAENLDFAPTLRFTGAVDSAVDQDTRAALLMVLREALSNVVRHADAHSVHVAVAAKDHHLVVVVTDDGVGLPTDVQESGLGNVRQRAAERGGSADLRPHVPRGTVLRWQVPLPA